MDRSTSNSKLIDTGQYILLAAVLVTLVITSWSTVQPSLPTIGGPKPALYLFIMQAILSAIVWAWSQFVHGMDPGETGLLRRFSLICFHSLTLACLSLVALVCPSYAKAHTGSTLIVYLSLSFSLCRFSLECVGIPLEARRTIAPKILATCGVILLGVILGLMAFGANGEKIANLLPLILTLIVVLMPIAVLISPPFSSGHYTINEYRGIVRKRIVNFLLNPLALSFFQGMAAVAVLWLYFAVNIAHVGNTLHPLVDICPWFIAGIFVLLRERKIHEQMALSYASVFAPTKISMRRFAHQLNKSQTPWAATMGIRTATFTIDSDPQHEFNGKMTATLGQIRKEEIHSYIERIIGKNLISFGSMDTKIFGAINPETSLRSCVDVLTFFACINMDVIPLVERRLKVLTSLFPIVDPDLANLATPETISHLLSKMNWTFFLEFGWVDQSVIKGANRIQYLIKSETNQLTNQSHLLSYIQKISKSGNIIWISEHARRKILMEAPFLAGTIESWQVPAVDQQGEEKRDQTIYLIKFDRLIPHLQQYYNLEDTRRILRDYEERVDTRKFINMIRMQLNRADSHATVEKVLQLLGAFEFYGFREKDAALNICLEAFERCGVFGKNKLASEVLPPKTRGLFIETIEKIGYPSQILHLAYVNKHALRDCKTIISICKSPKNPRFFESWALLLTLDARQFKEDELLDLIHLIIHALATPAIHSQVVFRAKCIEVFINIASALGKTNHDAIIGKCFNELAAFLVKIRGSVEHLAFFWDAKIHLEAETGRTLDLSPENMTAMQCYMDRLRSKSAAHPGRFIAIENRLKAMTMLNEKKIG